MKNKKKNQKKTRGELKAIAAWRRKTVITILVLLIVILYSTAYFNGAREIVEDAMNGTEITEVVQTTFIPVVRKTLEEIQIEKDNASLRMIEGTPLEEASEYIKTASETWSIPVALFTGIAKQESSFHKNYFIASDVDCFNPFGLKPSAGQRPDGSYLMCFDNWNQSLNYLGYLIKTHYFEVGLTTVEKIAPVYKCGGWNGSSSCLSTVDNWIVGVYSGGSF